jgi:hypothetical protein
MALLRSLGTRGCVVLAGVFAILAHRDISFYAPGWGRKAGTIRDLLICQIICPLKISANGVAARWPENQSPAFPAGHNPVGVDGPSIAATQGCPFGPTRLGYTTALRLKPHTIYLHGRLA